MDSQPLVTVARHQTAPYTASAGKESPVHRRRLGYRLCGHQGPVTAIVPSPDGSTLTSGGSDGRAIRWNINSLAAVTVYEEGDNAPICALALLPNGELLTGGYTNSIRRWSVEGHCVHAYPGCGTSGPPTAVADPDGLVRYLDTAVFSIAATVDGNLLAIGAIDGARLVEAGTGQVLRAFHGHRGWVTAVCLSPSGELLVTGGDEGLIILHDVLTGQHLKTLEGHSRQVLSLSLSKDHLLSGGADQTARLWHLPTARCLESFAGSGPVFSACLTQDHERAIVADFDGGIRIHAVGKQKCVATLTGHSGPVSALTLARDGTRLFSGGCDHTVRIWNLATDTACGCLGVPAGPVKAFSVDIGAKQLAVMGCRHAVKTWSLLNGRCAPARSLDMPQGTKCLTCNKPNLVLASNDSQTTRLLNAENGETLGTFATRLDRILRAAVNSDGSRLVLGTCEGGLLFDVRTGSLLTRLADPAGLVALAVHISSDSRRVAVGYWNNRASVFAAETGACLASAALPAPAAAVLLNSDGTKMVAGDRQGGVLFWDVTLKTALVTLPQGPAPACNLHFIDGDSRLLIARLDGTVEFWELEEPCLVWAVEHRARPVGIAVFPETRQLASVDSKCRALCFTDLETGRLLLRCHNLAQEQGFLWTAPDKGDNPILFCGDQLDRRIDVVSAENGAVHVLSRDNDERQAYLAAHQSQTLLARVTSPASSPAISEPGSAHVVVHRHAWLALPSPVAIKLDPEEK